MRLWTALIAGIVLLAAAIPLVYILTCQEPGVPGPGQNNSNNNNGTSPPKPPVTPHTPATDPNLTDADRDGLSDYNETRWGTNATNADTDGDGMPDGWEAKWAKRDPHTGEWLLDPNDPTDAYEDPDNDGYDFNHNGYIDGSEQDMSYIGYDWVYQSRLKVPAHTGYAHYNLNQILSNLEEHSGELVRVSGARVVDNGTYEQYNLQPERPIIIGITDQSTNAQMQVYLQPRSNRPVQLHDDRSFTSFPTDLVDVQGVVVGEGTDWHIEVRGTERFTNLMEFIAARDYDNNGSANCTDPLNWDTDGDGMSDGWEVHHGQGFTNTSASPPRWEWLVQLDPTYPGDASGEDSPLTDPDNDVIAIGPDRWVGYNRDEYLVILDDALARTLPSRNLADMLANKIDRSKFAYGMNPTMPDTDLDSFDQDSDGPTHGVDNNAEDFKEIFLYRTDPASSDTDRDRMPDGWEVHYGLCATLARDGAEDADADGLNNSQEFCCHTNPRMWDTDDEGAPRQNKMAARDDPADPACFDGMPDGWEVDNDLNPNDPSDQNKDQDVVMEGGVPVLKPDGLTNLQEYLNKTDPNDPDTDHDAMPDGWEVKNKLNPIGAADASQDADGDGYSNLQEYQNHTDPRNKQSHPGRGRATQDRALPEGLRPEDGP